MWVLSLVTLTCDLDLQTRHSEGQNTMCEFGATLFSRCRDISYTNQKAQTDGAKNRIFCSSLQAVKTIARFSRLLQHNREGLFLFQRFINLSLTYLLRLLPIYLQPFTYPHRALIFSNTATKTSSSNKVSGCREQKFHLSVITSER